MGFHGGAGHLFCLRPVLPPAAAIGYEPTRRGLYKAPFYIMADMGRLGGAGTKRFPYGCLHGRYGTAF